MTKQMDRFNTISANQIVRCFAEIKEAVPSYTPEYWNLAKEQIKQALKELNQVIESRK